MGDAVLIGPVLIWGGIVLAAVAGIYAIQARNRQRPLIWYVSRGHAGEELWHRGPRPLDAIIHPASAFPEGETFFIRRTGDGEVRLMPALETIIYHRPRGDRAGMSLYAAGESANVDPFFRNSNRVPFFVISSAAGVARMTRLDRSTWNLTGAVIAPPQRPIDSAAVDSAFVIYALSLAGAMVALGVMFL